MRSVITRTASATTTRCGAIRITPRPRAGAASSRCQVSCSPPAASSPAMSAGCPACTRCGPAPIGPGINRCGATTQSPPKRWLSNIIEHDTRFAGRAIQQVYHVDFYNQGGEKVAAADSWCFRTDRDQAREQGSKYTDVKSRPPPRYTEAELARIYRLYAEEDVRGATPRYWDDVTVGEALPTMVKGPMTVTGFIAYRARLGRSLYPREQTGLATGARASRPRHRQPVRHPRLPRARALGSRSSPAWSVSPAPTTTARSAVPG